MREVYLVDCCFVREEYSLMKLLMKDLLSNLGEGHQMDTKNTFKHCKKVVHSVNKVFVKKY